MSITVPSPAEPKKLVLRISPVGYWYSLEGREHGPFDGEQEDPLFIRELAEKLGVQSSDVIEAGKEHLKRPVSFAQVADVLSSTVRQDHATKLILFCADLLALTEADQVNIIMSGESSTGKSWDALEIADYFPSDRLLILGGASPKAFIHQYGHFVEEGHYHLIDLEGKIIIFLDQPHYALLEVLRPLLSHDKKEIEFQITDKNRKGQNQTKRVIIRGFPTVIFCSSKAAQDLQELTRAFLLSPETSPEKIKEGRLLTIHRIADREGFKKAIQIHPLRKWLKQRIELIQQTGIRSVVIPQEQEINSFYELTHPQYNAPRQLRDIARILGLIKAHALLNVWSRERDPEYDTRIIAKDEDVDAGFKLWNTIAEANESGLSPQTFEVYKLVMEPLLGEVGVKRKEVIRQYHSVYGRTLSEQRLRKDFLPPWEGAGFIIQESDPLDRRRQLIFSATEKDPPHQAHYFQWQAFPTPLR